MPRQPRLDLPGLLHHVIARGIERRPLFLGIADYQDFLTRMDDILSKNTTRCLAWALMPNHVHLLMISGLEGLSRVMQQLLTGYATAFNLRHRRAGHLFQNRYKSIVCEAESYFLQLVRYIHLNPVRAGLVKTLEELRRYPWTGHAVLMGCVQRAWQPVDEVLGHWGSNRSAARDAYERFVAEGWNLGAQPHLIGGGLIRSAGGLMAAQQTQREGTRQAYDERILGSGDFVEDILRRAETEDRQRLEWGEYRPQDLLEVVAGLLGLAPAQLTSRSRGRTVCQGKALIIHTGREWLGRSLQEMADLTQMSSGCASRALVRGRLLAGQFNVLEALKRQKGSYVP